MFTNFTIGILLGLGASAWVYSKMMRKTGNNTKTALIVAGVAGAVALLLAVTLLNFIPTN